METEAIMYISDRATDVLFCLIFVIFAYELIKLFIPKKNDSSEHSKKPN